MKEIEKEKARLRQLSKLKDVKNTLQFTSIDVNGEKGETAEIVSKKVSISQGTYQRAKSIIEKAPEELKDKVRSGQTSISYAYKMIKREESHNDIPPLPYIII